MRILQKLKQIDSNVKYLTNHEDGIDPFDHTAMRLL
jgi:hypothetical protein